MAGGFSGMLSLHVDGSGELALWVATKCKLFLRATSLGGTESLIGHRRTFEGSGSTAPPHMLRLSIDLKDVDDLVEGPGTGSGPDRQDDALGEDRK